MMQDPYSFDLRRIFLGNLPLLFFVEILLRTSILYVWALIMLRLSGKRSQGELTALEVLIIIGLGSAVGDPMFYPNVPVLHGMLVVGLVIGLQRLVVFVTNRVRPAHKFVMGVPIRMVNEGQLDWKGVEKSSVARDELFMALREQELKHLGQVKRSYLEPDGRLSLFKFDKDEVRPGLPIVPPWDFEEEHPTYQAGDLAPETDIYACGNCGYTKSYLHEQVFEVCPRCGERKWTPASHEGVSS